MGEDLSIPPAGPGVTASSRHRTWPSFAALAAWLGLMLAAAPMSKIVPIGDDWAYAYSVKMLLTTGRLRISQFAVATSISHILWGTLFCLPTGFSQISLRVSVLTVSALALFIFERLLAELGHPPSRRLLGAALLALDPLFIGVTLSFYTDAFFLAAFLLSVLGLVKGSRRWLWVSSFASIAAALARQIGLAPALVGAVVLFRRGDRRGAAILLLPPLAALALQGTWFLHAYGATHATWYYAHQSLARLDAPATLARDTLLRLSSSAACLGLLVFPLGAAALLSPAARRPITRPRAVVAVVGGALWLTAFHARLLPPGFGDQLWYGGLGPAIVPGAAFKVAGWWASRALWAAGDAVSLITLMSLAVARPPRGGAAWLAAASALAFLPALLSYMFYDRYLLVLVPAAIAAALDACADHPRTAWWGAAILGALSWCGARDAAAWNAALWRAAARLEQRGYAAEDIRAGLSWDGALVAERNIAIIRRDTPLSEIKPYAWLALEHPHALLTFDPRPPRGTRRLFVESYATPLSARGGVIYADVLLPGVRPP